MIVGIGTDLCRAARLTKSLESPSFEKRVWGPEERAALQALPQARRIESAAANFAAKEAFLKACGTGLSGFALGEVQALRGAGGRPVYRFSGKAAAWMEERGLKAHLSLTHEAGLACAFCVLETETEP